MQANGADPIRLTNNTAFEGGRLAWSPDGSRIAFYSGRDGNFEIYVMNADGTNPTRVTNDPAQDRHPAWSDDGLRIVFTTDRDGNDEIYAMNADGTRLTRLTNDPAQDFLASWQR